MDTPPEILAIALHRANTDIGNSIVNNEDVRQRIELICRNIRNKALSRLILSCCLAKIHKPQVDICKPYTEIDGTDTFSGRTYDEAYIGQFIAEHRLPCNTTTAFLTPALRNRSEPLSPNTNIDDERVLTGYEMKMRPVTREDVDLAVQKILDKDIDNYIFITTSEIPQEVNNYAKSLYEKTGGVEIAVLDCISFLRHFLHLFHRSRTRYIEEYQQLVLNEPDSAVSQPLKELWLSLRSAAESGLGNDE